MKLIHEIQQNTKPACIYTSVILYRNKPSTWPDFYYICHDTSMKSIVLISYVNVYLVFFSSKNIVKTVIYDKKS